MRLVCSAALAALVAAAPAARAQDASADTVGAFGRVLQSWIALRASPGREALAMDRVASARPDWERGAFGSLSITRGSGAPHRVIACGIDEPSYVVSNVTDDGYLRVHVAGARPRGAFADAMHMGQRVIVLAADRAGRPRVVPGVFAVRSTHLWRRASDATWPPGLDDLWLDIGARSRAEVASLGVRVLDPVFRDTPEWSVGDAVVGPFAVARASCAAVAAAGAESPATGTTTFVIATQTSFGWSGLAAAIAKLDDVDTIVVVHPSAVAAGASGVTIGAATIPVLASRAPTVLGMTTRARFAGTNVETVTEHDLASLFNAVASAAGVSVSAQDVASARLVGASMVAPQPTDSLTRYGELLARLTDTYAVSGDEAAMRDVIRARLPAWARDSVAEDSSGNLVLGMGPDRDTVVFVAHMDEVGWEVTRAANGVATVKPVGGFYPWLWAGQPALLHVDSARAQGCRPSSGALHGVFLPPDSASRNAREMQVWFGDDLASLGDAAGRKVTSYKCATRLAGTRFTARSIDDRLGSASLILALESVVPARLTHKVIFVWSVQEETGLDGAAAIARRFGPSVLRVHAVDTFVSADSPLETGRFAIATIGDGAVLRALDNSSATPPDEIDRVSRIARLNGIALQIGTTNGGNDGSELVPFGAVDVPIGWPLRYSHSPAEVVDLRDLRSLSRLVAALAIAPAR